MALKSLCIFIHIKNSAETQSGGGVGKSVGIVLVGMQAPFLLNKTQGNVTVGTLHVTPPHRRAVKPGSQAKQPIAEDHASLLLHNSTVYSPPTTATAQFICHCEIVGVEC